ncbi:hypothetical protein PMAYCL1PPCAC_04108 [Pristionchus mayeri]|uniref:Uncharacterized protein n=1 Tax=Pristionchus mayeri TaxID=1317129 RepID=A0AAN4Z8G0_9BILA|nr:hypothetical protein PMAYCL1PPCAC_04108 [Pristionchus mayeri]
MRPLPPSIRRARRRCRWHSRGPASCAPAFISLIVSQPSGTSTRSTCWWTGKSRRRDRMQISYNRRASTTR